LILLLLDTRKRWHQFAAAWGYRPWAHCQLLPFVS